MYQLGRAYAANRQMPEAIARLAQGLRQGLDFGDGRTRRALWHRRRRRDATRRRRENCSSAPREAGNPRGVSNLAALGGGAGAPSDPARARELLSKAAETNAEAQYQLGMMLAEGNGGSKDDAAARALFEKAAAQNHPAALERMGAFAQEGRGGPKDSDAAKAYYQRAAALGDEDAKKALERMRCPYAIKDKRGNVVTNLCF